MSTNRVGTGGPQFRPQVEQKSSKETKETKDSKSADGKAGVGGQARSGGVRAKGKAKGKDLGTVGGLIAGEDNWTLEDEEQDRKRRSNRFFDAEMMQSDAVPEDFDDNFSMLENIPREFRGQVASGLAAARSFTRGTVGPRRDDDEEKPKPRGRKARK